MMSPATSRTDGDGRLAIFGSIVFYPIPGDGRAYLAAVTTPPKLQESVKRLAGVSIDIGEALLELRTGSSGDDVATRCAVEHCGEQLARAITRLSLEIVQLDALPASIAIDADPLTPAELDRIRRGIAPEGVAGAT